MSCIASLLRIIVENPSLHVRWLNTLSYMENCGARMIAACEHPTKVKKEILKHAAEEFRHAYYLKQQMSRVDEAEMCDYSQNFLLGGWHSRHYLQLLNIKTCQYLKIKMEGSNDKIRAASYILVTYAIELRAKEIYPIYHQVLKEHSSKVTVKSILLEEEEHLAEMEAALALLPNCEVLAHTVGSFEKILYQKWINALAQEIVF